MATKREPTGERLVRDDPAEDEEQDLVEYFDTHCKCPADPIGSAFADQLGQT